MSNLHKRRKLEIKLYMLFTVTEIQWLNYYVNYFDQTQ